LENRHKVWWFGLVKNHQRVWWCGPTKTIEGRFLNLSLKMRGNLVQSVQKPSETKSFEMESTWHHHEAYIKAELSHKGGVNV
jgi:hypothetical protein